MSECRLCKMEIEEGEEVTQGCHTYCVDELVWQMQHEFDELVLRREYMRNHVDPYGVNY